MNFRLAVHDYHENNKQEKKYWTTVYIFRETVPAVESCLKQAIETIQTLLHIRCGTYVHICGTYVHMFSA